ncbi:uncharacterized protein RHOBADRAFT_51357 [Rhodotorula graminis WP1]|uniref:Ribosome biogenesis protein SLX9 n=1 Tax=Rhodotorula graminis (strain WP1) TaxID=578459 RepID=A0A194S9W9_RHOGW|nr:uncharacterized protein RHOBADRAFT_51357 [Rhodotorula graminis WP1]KPV77513.1 hypothetical protein RHOBADRAFT_51357 [Rhodotorula graminis WP1]
MAPDDLADSYMMSTEEMAPIAAVKAAAALRSPPPAEPQHPDEADPQPHKQTKAQKAYNRRKELLDKVAASTTPYSKSHARRLRRHAQPANNLVASLAEVEAVLPDLDGAGGGGEGSAADDDRDDGEEYEMGDEAHEVQGGKAKGKAGKGKEKLTAKKRQRVLTAESARLPAIIKNEQFAKSPFATIRQHTLNTLIAQKGAAADAGAAGKAKAKARAAK